MMSDPDEDYTTPAGTLSDFAQKVLEEKRAAIANAEAWKAERDRMKNAMSPYQIG